MAEARNPAQPYFDSFSEKYDSVTRSIGWRMPAVIVEHIQEIGFDSSASLKILDVGTGTGQLAGLLQQYFPNAEIHGADISEHMLKIAIQSRRLKEDRALIANLSTKLPYPDNYFDLVVSSGTTEYIGGHAALQEMARITAPEGYVVSTFRSRSLSNTTIDFFNGMQNLVAKIFPVIEKVPAKTQSSEKNLLEASRELLTRTQYSTPYIGYYQYMWLFKIAARYVILNGKKPKASETPQSD